MVVLDGALGQATKHTTGGNTDTLVVDEHIILLFAGKEASQAHRMLDVCRNAGRVLVDC